MSSLTTARLLLIAVLCLPGAARAEAALSALARPDPAESESVDLGATTQLTLSLSQPVLWQVYTLDDPRRLVMDFGEVAFDGVDLGPLAASDRVTGLRSGPVRPGWSRLVLDLAEPMAVETAGLVTGAEDGSALLKLQLAPTSEEAFDKSAGAPESGLFALPNPADAVPLPRRRLGDGPTVVVLDPGHGGIDPGAEAGGVAEADLMLSFARTLRDELERAGGFRVELTREDDRFVPLERRVSIARANGAHVFLSLHADALAAGRASGASVYTLAEEASNEASRKLAARHDRDDLLAGLDLSEQDDRVAGVLMEMARRETRPRSDALADSLVAGIADATENLHKRPRLSANFSVLKAADIPSVLVELGFLSNPGDRTNLISPAWRRRTAIGMRKAIEAWVESDIDRAELLRQ